MTSKPETSAEEPVEKVREETRALGHLMEECAEVIHVCGKILRHGWYSSHPDYGNVPNDELLGKEIDDVVQSANKMKRVGREAKRNWEKNLPWLNSVWPPDTPIKPKKVEVKHRSLDVAKLRALSFVPRWSIRPVRSQSVAEHSFHVAWLYVFCCQQLGVAHDPDYVLEALVHDREEAVTGDMPCPRSKVETPDDEGLHSLMLKFADRLEGVLFLKEEEAQGNTRVRLTLLDGMERLNTTWRAIHEEMGKEPSGPVQEFVTSTYSITSREIMP